MIIKFIKSGANSVIGGFAPGDIARVDAEFANHLVETEVAIYAESKPVEAPIKPPKTAQTTKKQKHK